MGPCFSRNSVVRVVVGEGGCRPDSDRGSEIDVLLSVVNSQRLILPRRLQEGLLDAPLSSFDLRFDTMLMKSCLIISNGIANGLQPEQGSRALKGNRLHL